MPRVVEPGDLAHRRRAAVAVGRAPAHQRPAGDRLPAAQRPRPLADRRVVRRRARAVDPRRRAPSCSASGTQPGAATPSIARACSTARRAARGSSIRSRRSSARGRGTATSPTGSPAPGAGVGVGGALGSRTAYFWDRVRLGRAARSARASSRRRSRPTAMATATGTGRRPATGRRVARRTAAREPAGRDAAAAPAARRAVPCEPVATATTGEPTVAPMARSQCGVDVVAGHLSCGRTTRAS